MADAAALRAQLAYLERSSPFYRERLAGARTLPGNAFKVPLARNVIVSTLLELMEASR